MFIKNTIYDMSSQGGNGDLFTNANAMSTPYVHTTI